MSSAFRAKAHSIFLADAAGSRLREVDSNEYLGYTLALRATGSGPPPPKACGGGPEPGEPAAQFRRPTIH